MDDDVTAIEETGGEEVGGELVRLKPEPLTPMEMVAFALKEGRDLAVLDKLMDFKERWEASEARKAFDQAMSAVRADLKPIRRDARVAFDAKEKGKASTDYRHETLGGIAEEINPILAKHGLSYRFRTDARPGEQITVTCIISHRLGHAEENTISAQHDSSGNKNSIQAIGSTITYLQRYTLKAALGLAVARDDDGAAADGDLPITEEQQDQLADRLLTTDSDVAKFCRLFGVEHISDLRQSRFSEALAMINAKAKAQAKRGAA